jgi:Holliday junction DNA helicase RuvA
VASQDTARIVKVPGIGKKTAERLLLELKDKLGAIAVTIPAAGAAPSGEADVLNALLSLGYNDKEASWAVKQLPPDVSVSDGIRQALKLLSKS